MNKFEILNKIALVQRDNGVNFTVNLKLDMIRDILHRSSYREVYAGNLTSVWSRLSEEEMKTLDMPCLLTSHIDNVKSIRNPFVVLEDSAEYGRLLRGTFDNMATNAALVDLMLNKSVPENVFFCLDGDEETGNCKGLKEAVEWIQNHCDNEIGFAIATDVTEEGFDKGKYISLENMSGTGTFQNNFCLDFLKLNKNFSLAPHPSETWRLPDCMKDYYKKGHEGWCDEGYVIRDLKLNGVSLCLPITGPMHSDKGCVTKPEIFSHYVTDLYDTTKMLALMDKERILGKDEQYEKAQPVTHYRNYDYEADYSDDDYYVSPYIDNNLEDSDLEIYEKKIESCKDEYECCDMTFSFLIDQGGMEQDKAADALADIQEMFYSEGCESVDDIRDFFIMSISDLIEQTKEYKENKENVLSDEEREEDTYYQTSLFDDFDEQDDEDLDKYYNSVEPVEYDDYGL